MNEPREAFGVRLRVRRATAVAMVKAIEASTTKLKAEIKLIEKILRRLNRIKSRKDQK